MANRNVKKIETWLNNNVYENQEQADQKLKEFEKRFPVSFKKAIKRMKVKLG